MQIILYNGHVCVCVYIYIYIVYIFPGQLDFLPIVFMIVHLNIDNNKYY